MKKLFILLLFILPFSLIAQETITLDTPFDREITVTIPENHEDCTDLIVDISELYWGERYDLEKKLEDEEKLLARIDDLKKQLKESNNTIESLKKSLKDTQDLLEEKTKPDVFRWGINISGGAIFNDPLAYTLKGSPYIQLFERVNIGIEIGVPLQASIIFGIHF